MRGWTETDVIAINARRGDHSQRARRIAAAVPVVSKSKYKNRKCTWGGLTFDSKHELNQWLILKERERVGEIDQLERQVPYHLHVPGGAELWKYVADFRYRECATGTTHVVDAKGFRTRQFLAKARHLLLEYGIAVELV